MIKKILFLIFTIIIFIFCLNHNKEIMAYIFDTFSFLKKNASILENNNYALNNNYEYVKLTNNFNPKNKQDIINIYYTVINSGMTNFTFYCPKEYSNCVEDINYISNNQLLLSNINNFVPVYNSFKNISTKYDSLGKIDITITHNYSESDINTIENKIDEIMKEIIKDNMTNEDKIKAIHDYIINTTKYDINRSDNKVVSYKSDIAYGALIEHYAICGGYADSIKLFLDRLNIPNYKLSSENHVWNLVYVNNNWYHLDLTWDDPVISTGEDTIEYNYFLITNEELYNLENKQHNYDKNIFSEALNN